ncbi:MAG TPA: hypothetical protein DCQ98_00485 [Planctomycetaceae bacterium]|nr:hypothetical protein [Planctomycetaceae bacterium]
MDLRRRLRYLHALASEVGAASLTVLPSTVGRSIRSRSGNGLRAAIARLDRPRRPPSPDPAASGLPNRTFDGAAPRT